MDESSRSALGSDHPRELLQQFLVVQYEDIDRAHTALFMLRFRPGVLHVAIDRVAQFAWAPNDAYFAIDPSSAGRYQWGMHAMSFPEAWDKTKGHGYVGVIDSGYLNDTAPADLAQNHRAHFSFPVSAVPANYEFHGSHVAGIIAATANNGIGVTGGCPTCSIAMARLYLSVSGVVTAMNGLVDHGMQVINMSFESASDCSGSYAICVAIASADLRDVALVAAAGNKQQLAPAFPASQSSVLAVGGAENTNPASPSPYNWVDWDYNSTWGSAYAGTEGVMAPARSVVSTVPAYMEYIPQAPFFCTDRWPADESGVNADGYASCTGTSMSAPHVSALAGILRSINPRLPRDDIYEAIRASGTDALSPTSAEGHGLPQADLAVDDVIYQTTNRLTPLFSQWSWNRRDYFYTTVPQMATAATWGTLAPYSSLYVGIAYRYVSAGGYAINGYTTFPDGYTQVGEDYSPKSAAWIFTTPESPKSTSVPLVPLYRLSWKCGDYTPSPPAVCSSWPAHVDTTYTADSAGVTAFVSVGYKLDGIEGYIYPKTLPQPTGTVKLMRKYNPDRDDHAIFPENLLSYYTSAGYTQNSGSDWLGYVYFNSNGNVPTIY